MKKTSVSTSDGFTLLEVLISLAIMAVVLVAVFKLHAQSISMNNTARFHTTAPLLVQQKLSVFKTTPLAELASDSGDFGENFPGYTWQLFIEDVESESLGEISERLKKINITITFGKDEYRYRLITYHFFQ
jgi:general secretion pathway protein I